MTGLLFGVLALITGERNGVVEDQDWVSAPSTGITRGIIEVPELPEPYTHEPDFFPVAAVRPYREPLPDIEPRGIVYTELAQEAIVLDPRQPLYEEKLEEVYETELRHVRGRRAGARARADIIQPEYEAPPMPRYTRARRGR